MFAADCAREALCNGGKPNEKRRRLAGVLFSPGAEI
jgi:hypothetical protein